MTSGRVRVTVVDGTRVTYLKSGSEYVSGRSKVGEEVVGRRGREDGEIRPTVKEVRRKD